MTNIVSNTRNHYHESTSMTAVHILTRLTQEGKSIAEIARSDFDNNMELVTVWINYMIAINWMYKNSNNSSKKWRATHNGKKGIEKYHNIKEE